MAYCIHCGKQLPDGAKFCAYCGKSVANASVNNENERKVVYDGEIHKCPSCGAALPPFTAVCPSCGHEIQDKKVSEVIRDFTREIKQAATKEQQLQIIKNYPIPNTKEDIFEFMLLSVTNITDGLNQELCNAWKSKFEQCYKKSLLFESDADFSKIQKLYRDGCQKMKLQKKQNTHKSVFLTVGKNFALCIGIALIVASIVIEQAGENSSMAQLIGCIVLLVSTFSFVKLQASFIDFIIGLIGCLLTMGLSSFLQNGSLVMLCSGIALILVTINFLRRKNHSH